MNTAKPIETSYKGYRFRSRHEARWAVFFDVVKIKWEYEPEGFELPSYQYDSDAAMKCYMDRFAKDSPLPQSQNRELATKLVARTAEIASKPIYYLPDFWLPDVNAFAEVKPPAGAHRQDRDFLLEYEKMMRLVNATNCKVLYCSDFVNPIKGMKAGNFDDQYPYPHVEFVSLCLDADAFGRAVTAARSARFEHGESPKV